ncbi:hypothetical protein PIB30_111058, partial [Stylosanthes scabra]|nr:hypothetical protein [Stylosanthes scabra]
MVLRKLFRARLRDFVESHPEGDEIPEDALPEPFNPRQHHLSHILKRPFSSKEIKSSVVIRDNDTKIELSEPVRASIEPLNQQPSVASHVPRSFTRRFSQMKENGTDNDAQEKLPSDSFQTVVLPDSESNLSGKPTSEGASNEVCLTNSSSSGAPPATPCKTIEHAENNDGSQKSFGAVSTPDVKCISTPASITPALPAPKRHFMSPDDNSSTTTSKLVRRPPLS